MIGSVIENYKIISVLGEGGMGVVYKALDMKLERFVALKILGTQSLNSSQFIERFKREARNQAKLNHPNIVPVFGFTDDNGILGIAMEYVEGETLEKIIFRKKRLEVVEALNIIKQVLAGVGYAHSKGFIHRDIKPSNIIISREGTVKIMDFGISKSIFEKGITKTGTKIGTILYMSPEQIRAEEPTRQSDIYSIGITLYEMLTGITPFDYGTEYDIMEGHLKKTPQRVSLTINTIPPEVDKIVAKALDKLAIKRYKSCDEFNEELEPVILRYSQKAPTTYKEAKKEPVQRSGFIHKTKITLLTAVILGMFLGLAYLLFQAISDFWPSITKLEPKSVEDTTSGVKNSPKYVEKSNFAQLSTGISGNLNSVYFVDEYLGIACGEAGTIIKTTDGGEAWQIVNFPDSISLFDVRFSSAGSGFLIGEGGRIYKTTDLGDTWVRVPVQVNESLFSIEFVDNSNGFIVGSKGMVLRTTNSGNNWYQVRVPTSNLLYNLAFADNSTGFIVGWNGTVLKTNNGGVSWETVPSFTDKYLRDVALIDQNIGIVCGAGGEVFRTSDGGKSWTSISTASTSGLASVLFVNDSRGLIVSTRGEILESFDGGNSWKINPSGNYFSLSKIAASGKNLYVAGFNGVVLKSGF
ncbi:MAG: protein kinase [Ignavibacteriaceae bacterium]|nr:protein kinase [Ignavibacteriaceae bacterium]